MKIGIQELSQDEQKLISYYRNAEQDYRSMAFDILRMSSDQVNRQHKSQQVCEVLSFPHSR